MTGKALVCKLGQHVPIEGADKIVQVDMFGETIITQKSNEEGTIGLLFDCETQLSKEYASANNMFRHSDLNTDKKVVGYMNDSARVKPIKLKGVKCSALFMPITTLAFISTDSVKYLMLGQEIDSFDGVEICKKYISKKTKSAINTKEGRFKKNLVSTFKEHMDTDQWGRNKHKVQEGSLVIITEKLHGTSGRCGYLPVVQDKTWWQKLLRLEVPNQYKFVVGSRRVVKSIGGDEAENKDHFYDEDLWTKISKENFEGKLHKGETVYFEIVGYTPSGELIMPSVSNKKLEKFLDKKEYKEFIKKYGETTFFRYGCYEMIHNGAETITNKSYKIFVYRITMTNEDGNTIDYSWEQVKNRCEQLDVQHVPELAKIHFMEQDIDYINECVQSETDSDSNNFPQHIREGVCIRIENGNMNPILLKNKCFTFKVLEGIIKDTDVIDIEESN